MARYSSKNQVSEATRHEAMLLAKGTQSAGQTKAQTKLIAQGIERGIDLYKKEQKEKARAMGRRLRDKRQTSGRTQGTPDTTPTETAPASGRQWLPWLLLALTWVGIGAYLVLNARYPDIVN